MNIENVLRENGINPRDMAKDLPELKKLKKSEVYKIIQLAMECNAIEEYLKNLQTQQKVNMERFNKAYNEKPSDDIVQDFKESTEEIVDKLNKMNEALKSVEEEAKETGLLKLIIHMTVALKVPQKEGQEK